MTFDQRTHSVSFTASPTSSLIKGRPTIGPLDYSEISTCAVLLAVRGGSNSHWKLLFKKHRSEVCSAAFGRTFLAEDNAPHHNRDQVWCLSEMLLNSARDFEVSMGDVSISLTLSHFFHRFLELPELKQASGKLGC